MEIRGRRKKKRVKEEEKDKGKNKEEKEGNQETGKIRQVGREREWVKGNQGMGKGGRGEEENESVSLCSLIRWNFKVWRRVIEWEKEGGGERRKRRWR